MRLYTIKYFHNKSGHFAEHAENVHANSLTEALLKFAAASEPSRVTRVLVPSGEWVEFENGGETNATV